MSKNKTSGGLGSLLATNRHLMLILIIAVIGCIFQFTTNGMFLSSRNLGTLFLQFSVVGYLTIGIVFVMVTRGIDLSIASVIALIAAVGAVLNVDMGVHPAIVLGVMLVAALIVASVQGFFVAAVGIPAFVVTLAGQLTLKGASLLVSNGEEHAPVDDVIASFSTTWIPPAVSIALILALGAAITFGIIQSNRKARLLGVSSKSTKQLIVALIPVFLLAALLIYVAMFKGLPIMFAVLMGWAGIAFIILEHTAFGRHVYAVGANPEAARLNGIDPRKILFVCFLMMGVSYFLGSVGSMSRITGYSPSIASGIEMDAIAAAVIGGTSLMGGYGTIFGAVLGAILLSSIDNGMILMDVSTNWQYVVKGLILLAAVVIDIRTKRN